MLTAFGQAESEAFLQIMLGASGAAVMLIVQGIALYMIINAGRKLAENQKKEVEINGESAE